MSRKVMLDRPETESGPKELRVKIRVEYHLKLHALKLLKGKRMSDAVEEALELYFEKVKLEREAQENLAAFSRSGESSS